VNAAASRILRVDNLDFALEQKPWAFALERADEIEQNWRERKAAKPKLFDGRVLLLGRHEFATLGNGETVLRGGYFEVNYSAFLAWRDFGFPDASVCNCFSMAALVSSDGSFLLGEMNAHTANSGSIYFAAGTPDANDIIAGKVDLTASVTRELQEETGVAPGEVTMDAGWVVVYAPPRIACMKPMRIALPAALAQARIEAFLRNDPQPELARMHIVTNVKDIDKDRSPQFLIDYLRHTLRQGQSSVG
jgi:hypothetical protein